MTLREVKYVFRNMMPSTHGKTKLVCGKTIPDDNIQVRPSFTDNSVVLLFDGWYKLTLSEGGWTMETRGPEQMSTKCS
jgi:hypothetical protein